MKATKNTTQQAIVAAYNGFGNFMALDGIESDLDGESLAAWIEQCGYPVLDHRDIGSNGRIQLENGVVVSSNGYCYMPGRNPPKQRAESRFLDRLGIHNKEQDDVDLEYLKDVHWQEWDEAQR